MRIVRYAYPASRSLAPAFGLPVRSPWAGLESEIDRFFESALSGSTGAPLDNRFIVDLYDG